jgi:hypothetical protein
VNIERPFTPGLKSQQQIPDFISQCRINRWTLGSHRRGIEDGGRICDVRQLVDDRSPFADVAMSAVRETISQQGRKRRPPCTQPSLVKAVK